MCILHIFKEILNKCQNFMSKQTKLELGVLRKPEQGSLCFGVGPPASHIIIYLFYSLNFFLRNSWAETMPVLFLLMF